MSEQSVSAIATPFDEGASLTRDDAAEVILKRWTQPDAETEPSSTTKEESAEDTEETAEPEEAQESEESTESEEEAEEAEESEEDPQDDDSADPLSAKVKFKADGQEVEVSVKDLTRLYGQEAALTKKSQAVSEKEKQLAQAQEYVESTLELALAQAEERIKPYKDIDWVVASKRLSEEELVALRGEAQKVYEDYQKLTAKVTDYQETKTKKQQEEFSKIIQQTHETLSDPAKGIEGWGKQKYEELADYAQSLGFPKQAVDSFITPEVWKLLDKAAKYDKGKTVATEKINKTPRNLVTTTKKTPAAAEARNARAKAALENLAKSGGSRDAATDAFLARWQR